MSSTTPEPGPPIAASYIGHHQVYLRDWLIVWLTEAVLAREMRQCYTAIALRVKTPLRFAAASDHTPPRTCCAHATNSG